MKRLWIVGAGKRVRETALPAIASLSEAFEVGGVLARSERALDAAGRRWSVRPLASLAPRELADGDVVYVAVGKDAVPDVLRALARFDRSKLELLIDTPVLRFKHLRYAPLLAGWARAGVAEDVAFLPWYATARAAVGRVTDVAFDRSAYAYHGCAQAKALLGAERIVSARRVESAGGARRTYRFADERAVVVVEPRDYAQGRVVVHGEHASVSDRWERGEVAVDGRVASDADAGGRAAGSAGVSSTAQSSCPRFELLPVVERGLCVGFRAGDVATRLDPREAELTRGDAEGASITARMESMKRIGFRRLLRSIADGRGAYPIEQGLDDTTIDWFLERFGRWSAGGPFDVRRPLPRALWSVLGRLR